MTRREVHPNLATLLDWVEGRLDDSDAQRIAEQVERSDDRTCETVTWLRGFVEMAQRVELEDPPPFVRRSLMRHFTEWSAQRVDDPAPMRNVVAELSFDSRRDLAVSGVRGGADAGGDGTFHLAFVSDAGDVFIEASRRPSGRLDIDGQVLPANESGASTFAATLRGATFASGSVDTDALRRFSIRDVPAEPCRLRVDDGRLAIVAEVDLRARPDA